MISDPTRSTQGRILREVWHEVMASVIVHGGAYTIPDSIAHSSVQGCQAAAEKAYKTLIAGNSAMDAVETAVRVLEDDPIFDAGCGSVLNCAGGIEMSSIIMDGSTLNYGSVAGVKNFSNPVSLARMVMERTDHVMLIGEGANDFARDMGIPEVDPLELVTEQSRKEWEEYQKYKTVVSDVFNSPNELSKTSVVTNRQNSGHDTVGAVAIDLQGNLAAATSTGGISLQRVGRVGDSPLVGCGAYCDNDIGGVSTTGHGESIAKVVLAQRALNLLQSQQGLTPEGALAKSLEFMWNRVKGCAGIIMITKDGEIAKCFTTKRMCWASVNKLGVMESGINGPLQL